MLTMQTRYIVLGPRDLLAVLKNHYYAYKNITLTVAQQYCTIANVYKHKINLFTCVQYP
jgi:hypothetical protein